MSMSSRWHEERKLSSSCLPVHGQVQLLAALEHSCLRRRLVRDGILEFKGRSLRILSLVRVQELLCL